ncbi:MAG: M48 family metallopeptidase [Planctomycetota bacterium]
MRTPITSMLTLATLFAVALSVVACKYNTATGRRQLSFISIQDQISLGEEAGAAALQEGGGPLGDSVVNQHVSRIGMQLVQHVEPAYRDLPWEFTVVDSDQINAFALPGGKIYIHRGLMQRMTNDAQLAGVIAHEIGHVVGEHTNERMSGTILAQIGASAGIAAITSYSSSAWVADVVPSFIEQGTGVLLLKYNRDQESESDTLGLRYMTSAGYNPRGMLELMQILQRASAEGARQPEFLSTHPHPETRVATIERLLAGDYAQAAADLPMHADSFRQNIGMRIGTAGI